MQCRDFREIADSYLSDELTVETNHEVLKHLETCAVCRTEIGARREIRIRLKTAVKNDERFQIGEGFATELKAKLQEVSLEEMPVKNRTFGRQTAWLAIAASFLLVALLIGVGIRYQLRKNQNLSSNNNSNAIILAREAMAHFAVGDHKNCALQHNLEEMPISLSEAAKRYDKTYAELDKAVMKAFDNNENKVEFLGAHACIFEGKKFAHVVLRTKGKIVSFLVVNKEENETNSVDANNSTSISCQPKDGFQVSCFDTQRHQVFIVSDMSEQDNLTIARTLQSSIMNHLS